MTSSTVRNLWLAIITLTATLVGAAGGLLAWIGGLNPPNAILTGAGAFGSTILLAIAVASFRTSTPG